MARGIVETNQLLMPFLFGCPLVLVNGAIIYLEYSNQFYNLNKINILCFSLQDVTSNL